MDARGAGQELQRIGRRLTEAGGGSFRSRVTVAIRRVAEATIPDIRASEYDVLPKHGGLADLIASSKVGIRARLSGTTAGVSIVGGGTHNLTAMNAGLVHHPRFGDRGSWFAQSIRPGMFTDPIEAKAPEFERSIQAVMQDTAQRILKG